MPRPEPIDLDAAQALVDATSEGSWLSCYDGDLISSRNGPVAVITERGPGDTPKAADAEFIAQSRTLVPALIAELRGTRSERDGYRDRGRVYEGKVQTLREDLHAALAAHDVSPTLEEFRAAGRGE